MARIGLDLQAILQTAADVADHDGYDAVTLASLAKRLGIRSPSLYNHVDGLEGLRKKLAIFALQRLTEVLTDAAVGRSGDEAIRALGYAYVGFARAHPGLYEAALRAPDTRDSDVQQAGEAIVKLSVRVLEAYGLTDEAALHAVRGLRSILHGFASLEKFGGFGLPLRIDESLARLLDVFIAGLHVQRQ